MEEILKCDLGATLSCSAILVTGNFVFVKGILKCNHLKGTKSVPQLFMGSLLRRRRSVFGHFLPLLGKRPRGLCGSLLCLFPSKVVNSNESFRSLVLGTLRNHEDDGNGNFKKTNRFNEQNNNSARTSRFFVHLFAFNAQLRREMTKF